MKIKIETKIDAQVLEDIFVTAIEGGSNYWFTISNADIKLIRQAVPKEKEDCLSMAIYKAVCEEGLDLPIFDVEDEDEMLGILSMSTIPHRLGELMQSGENWALRNELDGNGDADSSDIVFQYLVMGEAIYG